MLKVSTKKRLASELILWIAKTVGFFVVFNFIFLVLLHGINRSHYAKLSAMFVLTVISGVLMVALNYVPGILLISLLITEKYALDAMEDSKWVSEYGIIVNRRVQAFYGYTYILLSCGMAYFLQIESYKVVDGHLVLQGMIWINFIQHIKEAMFWYLLAVVLAIFGYWQAGMNGRYSPIASLIACYSIPVVLFFASWKAGVTVIFIYVALFLLNQKTLQRAKARYTPPEGSLSDRYLNCGGEIIPSPAFEEWLQETYAAFQRANPHWNDNDCWISTFNEANRIMRKNRSNIW